MLLFYYAGFCCYFWEKNVLGPNIDSRVGLPTSAQSDYALRLYLVTRPQMFFMRTYVRLCVIGLFTFISIINIGSQSVDNCGKAFLSCLGTKAWDGQLLAANWGNVLLKWPATYFRINFLKSLNDWAGTYGVSLKASQVPIEVSAPAMVRLVQMAQNYNARWTGFPALNNLHSYIFMLIKNEQTYWKLSVYSM